MSKKKKALQVMPSDNASDENSDFISTDAIGSFSVQAAAKQAGVSPHTLRTWETRYKLMTPLRTDSGHRRYHHNDVTKLTIVAALVRRGHQISAIAHLTTQELQRLGPSSTDLMVDKTIQPLDLDEPGIRRSIESSATNLPPHIHKRYLKLEQCIDTFDPAALAMGIKWLRTMLGVRAFVLHVAIPLFKHLGEKVAAGRVDIGREHAFSAVLRDQIGDMLHTLQALGYYDDLPRKHPGRVDVIFATPESDYHEFGILLGAALAASWGIQLCFAGANLPAKNLAETTQSLNARIIILGNAAVPATERRMSFEDYLLQLDNQLSDDGKTPIWVGGQGDRPLNKLPSGRKIHYLNSMHDLDAMLADLP